MAVVLRFFRSSRPSIPAGPVVAAAAVAALPCSPSSAQSAQSIVPRLPRLRISLARNTPRRPAVYLLLFHAGLRREAGRRRAYARAAVSRSGAGIPFVRGTRNSPRVPFSARDRIMRNRITSFRNYQGTDAAFRAMLPSYPYYYVIFSRFLKMGTGSHECELSHRRRKSRSLAKQSVSTVRARRERNANTANPSFFVSSPSIVRRSIGPIGETTEPRARQRQAASKNKSRARGARVFFSSSRVFRAANAASGPQSTLEA